VHFDWATKRPDLEFLSEVLCCDWENLIGTHAHLAVSLDPIEEDIEPTIDYGNA